MRSNISGQITFTGLERHSSHTETSTFQAEEEKKPERIFCPQGYVFQKKIEKLKGLDYCREHCSAQDKYTAMKSTAECYWIIKEGEINAPQKTPSRVKP